jgi:hypothetical protein
MLTYGFAKCLPMVLPNGLPMVLPNGLPMVKSILT